MLKSNVFYEITSIHRNKEFCGNTFWDSGYKYTYTPASYAVKYIRGIAEVFNDKYGKKKNIPPIEWCVVKSNDEQELYIKITGKSKYVEAFVSEIFMKDPEFMMRFKMRPVPGTYL